MQIIFRPNDKGNPPGKLADVELHFDDCPGTNAPILGAAYGPTQTEALALQAAARQANALYGLKLIGLGIWVRRDGRRSLTVPSRQYSVSGERQSFALLRPIADAGAQNRLRDLILAEFEAYEIAQQEEKR